MATAFDRHSASRLAPGIGYTPEQVCVLAQVSYPYLRAIEDGYQDRPEPRAADPAGWVYGRDVRELFTDDADRAGAR